MQVVWFRKLKAVMSGHKITATLGPGNLTSKPVGELCCASKVI